MRTRLRVKEVAESKNFNMSSLSRASNISFNTIKRLWTHPYEGAKIDTLLKIARVLDVQVTELIEEFED
jgi:DNA-binding Xre family transcriptional regulator